MVDVPPRVPPEVHPELRAAWAKAPRLPYHKLQRLPVMRRVAAVMGATAVVEGVEVETVSARDVRLRVYRPEAGEGGAALLWMHGGGFLLGAPSQDDARCSRWARELGIVVVSVHYRFAPEHPFPAASDDCLAGWRWCRGAGFDRVAVGGASAGGGLAAAVCQRLRDAGEEVPAAQLLLWPMLDDRTAADDSHDPQGHVVWNNQSNAAAWQAYLGVAPGSAVVPAHAVAGRCPDLHGLPPAWLSVGSLDLFAAESRDYATRLGLSDVAVEFDEVPGAFHDFSSLAPQASVSKALEMRVAAFLRNSLRPPG